MELPNPDTYVEFKGCLPPSEDPNIYRLYYRRLTPSTFCCHFEFFDKNLKKWIRALGSIQPLDGCTKLLQHKKQPDVWETHVFAIRKNKVKFYVGIKDAHTDIELNFSEIGRLAEVPENESHALFTKVCLSSV